MCFLIILSSSFRFIEKAAFQLSLSVTIIHLIEKKLIIGRKNDSYAPLIILQVCPSYQFVTINPLFLSLRAKMRRLSVRNQILRVG